MSEPRASRSHDAFIRRSALSTVIGENRRTAKHLRHALRAVRANTYARLVIALSFLVCALRAPNRATPVSRGIDGRQGLARLAPISGSLDVTRLALGERHRMTSVPRVTRDVSGQSGRGGHPVEPGVFTNALNATARQRRLMGEW